MMKVAIVYDRVNKWGGAERVLLTLHEMFPNAPLYTSVCNSKTTKWASVFPKIYTSFLQKIPFAKRNHELLAPLMPMAFESFDFRDYDLVISVTSEAAKGIITQPGTKHLCYLLTPTRYLWSGYDDYFKGSTLKMLASPVVRYLRSWDKVAARRPDKLVAISDAVKRRIDKYYDLDSEIIYPPVDLEKFKNKKGRVINKHGEYYLVVSRLVSYKKVDLAINAFNILGKKLVVIGSGKERSKLKKMAKKNIIFENGLTDEELTNYYINTKALIFPQVEDFGLVAVEAQACGTPVIALAQGGALDTVVDGETGVFFEKQNVHSLISAIRKFNAIHFYKGKIKKNVEKFSKERFKREFFLLIDEHRD